MAMDGKDIAISDEVDVQLVYQKATGNKLLLWLPSESGILEQERKQAVFLASQGVEVWFADLLGAWFLSPTVSSIDSIPAMDVATLIEKIRRQTGKQIVLVANGRGAMTVLRAARAWQQKFGNTKNRRLGGAILLSPKLFVETPEPGLEGQLMPVVAGTNLPLMIIQPANSPWRWKLSEIVKNLEMSGSDVYVRVLPDIRDRFYYRPDATALEDKVAGTLGKLLTTSVKLLDSYNSKDRHTEGNVADIKVQSGKKSRALRRFQGNPEPPELTLEDLRGGIKSLSQYKGKVVLVNFWASWCPPCVHEMPSMQQLKKHFKGKPFKILAVNMAEKRATITAFLKTKVNVDFTILMDKDGKALKRWKVFAFPTSYVIGKKGKIRRALFGSIDWMNPDVVRKIEALVNE